jgi:hypothetical protein
VAGGGAAAPGGTARAVERTLGRLREDLSPGVAPTDAPGDGGRLRTR